jgi:nitric oxide reductase subunit C
LYGLGGYLGPDLSNIYSAPGKNEEYLKAMLTAGTAQMPVFELTGQEQAALLSFLKAVDQSGSADPRDFKIMATGMITRK